MRSACGHDAMAPRALVHPRRPPTPGAVPAAHGQARSGALRRPGRAAVRALRGGSAAMIEPKHEIVIASVLLLILAALGIAHYRHPNTKGPIQVPTGRSTTERRDTSTRAGSDPNATDSRPGARGAAQGRSERAVLQHGRSDAARLHAQRVRGSVHGSACARGQGAVEAVALTLASSSAVEHAIPNRAVAGSIPAWSAVVRVEAQPPQQRLGHRAGVNGTSVGTSALGEVGSRHRSIGLVSNDMGPASLGRARSGEVGVLFAARVGRARRDTSDDHAGTTR